MNEKKSVVFYSISTLLGYLMPNPGNFLCRKVNSFKYRKRLLVDWLVGLFYVIETFLGHLNTD